MQLLLISSFSLVVSWFLIIVGLHFAIKYKEDNDVIKSKIFYFVFVLGEIFGDVSYYAILISSLLLIIDFLK